MTLDRRAVLSAEAHVTDAEFGALLGGVVVLAVLLRFPTLAQQSLWTDEATTWGIVAHGLGHVLSTVPKTESTPPVYYVLLWLWTRLFGLGAFGLRSLSAVCGVLTVWLVGAAGRRLLDARLGIAAALLTAVSPIMVWYSQEARAYAMAILLSAASLWLLMRALERPDSSRDLLAWALSAAVALAVHYFTVFVVAPETAWLLVVLHRRGALTVDRVIICVGPPLLVAAALLPLLIHQANSGHAAFIASKQGSLAQRVVRLVKQFMLGLNEPLKALLSGLAGLLIALSFALLVWRTSPQERRVLPLPAVVGAGGVVLALLAAVLGFDYIDTRNLLPTWPALAILIAAALMASGAGRVGRLGFGTLVVLSLVCVASVVVTPLFQRADWRGVAGTLGRTHQDRVIVGDRLAFGSLAPYVPGLGRLQSDQSVTVREVDVFALALQSTAPPRAPNPPQLAGFRLVQRVDTDTYTFLRYDAARPTAESVVSLHRLGLLPGGASNVVLEQRSG